MSRLHPYKGRTLIAGTRVKVYRNLHNKMFSIVDLATGLVVAHSRNVRLVDVKFVVNEAGRQRVLRDKQKNVHAYVVGTFKGAYTVPQRHEAYYNPYEFGTFVTSSYDDTGARQGIFEAASVTLRDGKVYYTGRI